MPNVETNFVAIVVAAVVVALARALPGPPSIPPQRHFQADVEPTVPAATGTFELGKFSLALLLPFYRDALAVDVQKGSLDLAAQFALGAAPGTMVAVWHTLPWTGEDRWREFFPANVEQQL